jgi:hypothetical protein
MEDKGGNLGLHSIPPYGLIYTGNNGILILLRFEHRKEVYE